MLSPCIRQVTHALLTRPPLTFKSLGFIKSPFDLHVLSTPPAFILSQDQTLMLKSSSYQNHLALLFCLGGFFWISSFKSCSQIFFSEISRWVVLIQLSSWNFQGCITVYLSRFSSLLLAVVFSGNSVILSQVFCFVNNFFYFFQNFFEVLFALKAFALSGQKR